MFSLVLALLWTGVEVKAATYEITIHKQLDESEPDLIVARSATGGIVAADTADQPPPQPELDWSFFWEYQDESQEYEDAARKMSPVPGNPQPPKPVGPPLKFEPYVPPVKKQFHQLSNHNYTESDFKIKKHKTKRQ